MKEDTSTFSELAAQLAKLEPVEPSTGGALAERGSSMFAKARNYAALPPLAEIAKEAGAAILAMQPEIVEANRAWKENGVTPPRELIEIKPDESPVTAADKKAHAIVLAGLARHFPDVPVVSEEEPDKAVTAKALVARERFDTDPLDNTSGYLGGWNGYSVNIGRIVDGVPTEGAIYFPAKQELFYTGKDGSAYLQRGEEPPVIINVKKLPLRTPLKVAAGFNEANTDHVPGREVEVQKYPSQYRTCMVATGDCDVTGINHGFKGGFESWDTAGPHAVLRAAGGEMVTLDKKPLRYGDTTKLPAHVAGGVDTLAALGLLDKTLLPANRARG